MTKELFTNCCLRFLNLPYRWGGDDPIQGYDCSGLIQDLYAMLGIDPKGDQTAQDLHNYFKTRAKEGARQLGTLVFYGKSTLAITHVGMMLDEHYMLEAGGGGSQTNSLDAAAKANAFVRVRPFNSRQDIVAIITPQALPW